MHATHATASRIKSNKSCEFKYFLEYHLMYPPLKVGNIYAEKGSAIHVALEKWANAKLGETENAEVDFEKTLREYYAKTRLWELDSRPEGKGHTHPVVKTCESCPWATKGNKCLIADEQIPAVKGCPRPNFEEDKALTLKTIKNPGYNPLKLLKDADGNEVFEKKILGVEYKFDMELGGVPVRGVMDLVLEDDEDTLEICDYKSGRAMSYNKASIDPQVRIYGAVARILFPQYKYILVTLHYLKTRPVTVPLSEEDDELTIKSLQKNYREIVENKTPRRVKNWLCNYCVGYATCGTIYNILRVDGKFRLPIISCGISVGNPCWGRIYAANDQEIGPGQGKEIVDVCKRHAKCHSGGEYLP